MYYEQNVANLNVFIPAFVFLSHLLSLSLCLFPPLSLFLSLSFSLYLYLSLSLGDPLGMYQLHYVPDYTQSQLLRMITEIYEGVPEPFEVFYCHSITTQEEISCFMERVKHYPLSYLILNVNKLSFKLQEVCKMCPFVLSCIQPPTIHSCI